MTEIEKKMFERLEVEGRLSQGTVARILRINMPHAKVLIDRFKDGK